MDLEIRIGRDPGAHVLTTDLLVDGQVVLPDGLRGVDPDRLLPPLSTVLLPSSLGRAAMVGLCTCFAAGCASFGLSVRRDGQRVRWEPEARPLGRTLERTLDFPLLGYLDAVDAAAADPQLQERGRRLARATELQLRTHEDKYDGGGREVTLPMAWQGGDGTVKLRYRGQLHAVPLTGLPEDDGAAVDALTRLAWDPASLPTADD